MHDIILFGMQGTGKGTQAGKVLEAFPDRFSYLSTGDVFRALIKGGDNPIGKYITDQISQGHLISDRITIALFRVYRETVRANGDKAMLLDGYPRSREQVDDLLALAKKNKRTLQGINFVLDEQTAIQRMMSRGRKDDTPTAIQQRITEYYDKTKPIVEYFGQHCSLATIDASGSIDDIFDHVKEHL